MSSGARNTGVLAVQNGTAVTDLLIYNHAAFSSPIVDCVITVSVAASKLAAATVRRVDETHAKYVPLLVERSGCFLSPPPLIVSCRGLFILRVTKQCPGLVV